MQLKGWMTYWKRNTVLSTESRLKHKEPAFSSASHEYSCRARSTQHAEPVATTKQMVPEMTAKEMQRLPQETSVILSKEHFSLKKLRHQRCKRISTLRCYACSSEYPNWSRQQPRSYDCAQPTCVARARVLYTPQLRWRWQLKSVSWQLGRVSMPCRLGQVHCATEK